MAKKYRTSAVFAPDIHVRKCPECPDPRITMNNTQHQLDVCPRGFDPLFWRRYDERVENGLDPFDPVFGMDEWRTLPSVEMLDWWTFGNDEQNGWCYQEIVEGGQRLAEMGHTALGHEARVTNAIRGMLSIGTLHGPGIVIGEPGPNASLYRHYVLHVFTRNPEGLSQACQNVAERMTARGFIAQDTEPIDAAPGILQSGKRQAISSDLRADVWDKSRGTCWYCGVELHPFRNYHVDHFIPVADGGGNEITNLVPCCQPCNSRKQARPAEYLRRFIGSGVFWFEKEGNA